MTEPADPLAQLSNALVARTALAADAVAAIRLAHGRHLSGTVWRSDLVVCSEQSLPRQDAFDVVAAGGAVVAAVLAGRDPTTNIAILRLATPLAAPSLAAAEPRTGALALATGADGSGGASARSGLINHAGPSWHSSRGGVIDRRIILDINVARREEGGPVFDAAGGCLGMSTFGPRGQVLVIPAATLDRVVPLLLRDGRIARGWLGVGLQAVAVPDALREIAGQRSGLMVMSLVGGGPAAQAGLVAGDILLSINGISTHHTREIAGQFAADSIGRPTELRLIRGGQVIALQTIIAEWPAG